MNLRYFWTLNKMPIMAGFQSLWCLWKRLDDTHHCIMLKFSKTTNLTHKTLFENLKIPFASFSHDFGLSRGKIWLWLYIRLYFGAGRGGGWGRERGRVGGRGVGGGGGVGTEMVICSFDLSIN